MERQLKWILKKKMMVLHGISFYKMVISKLIVFGGAGTSKTISVADAHRTFPY